MRLPDFLVIGAMKSGTTTLYHDLASHPDIVLNEKEKSDLTRDVGVADIASGFKRAKSHQLCGDVSTLYSMLPDYPGVVERSRRLLSASTKIIYVVREPVQRAISHHYHYHAMTGPMHMGPDVDACVRQHACLTDYGRYAMQLEPWIRAWSLDAVTVIRLEDYTADRERTLEQLCHFLGIVPRPELLPTTRVRNAGHGKPVLNRFWRGVTGNVVYRRLLRPCLSLSARDRIRAALLPKAPPPPAPPNPQTIAYLVSVFAQDSKRLQSLIGRSAPLWEFEDVVRRHVDRYWQWESQTALKSA